MAFIKLVIFEMIPHLVDEILAFLVFVQCLDYVRQDFNFFVFGQFGVEIISFERFLQEGQHHQIRYQQIIVSLAGFWKH